MSLRSDPPRIFFRRPCRRPARSSEILPGYAWPPPPYSTPSPGRSAQSVGRMTRQRMDGRCRGDSHRQRASARGASTIPHSRVNEAADQKRDNDQQAPELPHRHARHSGGLGERGIDPLLRLRPGPVDRGNRSRGLGQPRIDLAPVVDAKTQLLEQVRLLFADGRRFAGRRAQFFLGRGTARRRSARVRPSSRPRSGRSRRQNAGRSVRAAQPPPRGLRVQS